LVKLGAQTYKVERNFQLPAKKIQKRLAPTFNAARRMRLSKKQAPALAVSILRNEKSHPFRDGFTI
jgi:hypothetical protein